MSEKKNDGADTVIALIQSLTEEGIDKVKRFLNREEYEDVDEDIHKSIMDALLASRKTFNRAMDERGWDVQVEFEGTALYCDGEGRPFRKISIEYCRPDKKEAE